MRDGTSVWRAPMTRNVVGEKGREYGIKKPLSFETRSTYQDCFIVHVEFACGMGLFDSHRCLAMDVL
jgi:hypothetical protein